MGSIRKRNSQWNAQVPIKGWRSLSKTFATKQLAEAWVRQTENNVRHAALTTLQPTVMSLQEDAHVMQQLSAYNIKGSLVSNIA